MRTRLRLVAAVVVWLSTACGNTVDDAGGLTSPSASSVGSTSESPDPDATPSVETHAPDGAGGCGTASITPPCVAQRFDADGAFHIRRQVGRVVYPADLRLATVRVLDHRSHDRIVLTFEGTGTPGFVARWVDQAIAEGTGKIVPVDGDAILRLDIYGTPSQPTGTAPPVRRRLAGDVVDLQGGFAREGVNSVFLGIDGGPTPFRPFVLATPSRLVIDVER